MPATHQFFWRVAHDDQAKQAPFFLEQRLHNNDAITLVAEDAGVVIGFVMALIQHAPPVYDSGGPVCSIDDYTVAAPALWPTVGADLLHAATRQAQDRGAVLVIEVARSLCMWF